MRSSKILLFVGLVCSIFFVVSTRTHAQTPTTLKLMVVRLNFTTSTFQPLTTAQLQSAYFDTSNPNSIASYYLANTGGRILITGTVVGPYTINPAISPFDICNINNWESQAETQMRAAGIDPSQYSYFQLLTPNYTGCPSTTGLSYYGVPGVYPSPAKLVSALFGYYYQGGAFVQALAAHEIGHLLGTGHAAYSTDDYGDHSDVMGNFWYIGGYKALGFDAPHLVNDGWTDPGEVQTVTQSGTYTINSLESGAGLRILEIPKPDTSEVYFLSMRQPIGIDANEPGNYLGGANLHRWYAPSYYRLGGLVYELSTHILAIPGDPNMAMADSSTYTDATNGITIKQLSHTASTATLSITLLSSATSTTPSTVPPCVSSAPTLAITPSTASGAPGSGTTYTVTLTSHDSSSCTSSQFNLANTSTLPSNVTASLSATSLTLAPGSSATAQLAVSTGATTISGSYALQLTGKHASAPAPEANATAFYTVVTPCTANAPIVSVSPTSYTDAQAGVTKQYTVSITNRDTSVCTPSTFNVTPQKPTGWSASATPTAGSVTLAPGAAANIVESITSPSTATAGTTNIPMQLSDAAQSAHTASVSVQYIIPAPACTVNSPIVSVSPTSYSDGFAGVTKQYTVTVTNKDTFGCTASTFTVTPQKPAGWSAIAAPLSGSVTLLPGLVGTIVESITPPSTVTPGTTNIPMQVSDTSNSAHTASVPVQYTIICTANPPTLSVSPTSYTDAQAGVTKQYTLSVTNKDTPGCMPSTFTITPQKPAGWSVSAAPSTGSITLAPGTAANIVESVTSPSTALPGTTNIPMQLSDAAHSAHAASVPVQYTIPACVRAAPLLSLSPSSPTSGTSGAGGQVTYSLRLTNQDSPTCGSSTFSLSDTLPGLGWVGSFSPPGTLTVPPGLFGLGNLIVTSPTNATVNKTYTVSAQVADTSVSGHTASASASYGVVSVLPTLPSQTNLYISATSVRSGGSSTLTWYVSSLAPGVSCTVDPALAINSGQTFIKGSITKTRWGSATAPITAQTWPMKRSITFTLTCSNGSGSTVSKSATAALIPTFKEI